MQHPFVDRPKLLALRKELLEKETPFTRATASGISRVVSSLGAALGFVLVPKCPLCVAAYLMSLGVSASAASFAAPLVRPFALMLGITATAALLYSAWRAVGRRSAARRARNRPACCC